MAIFNFKPQTLAIAFDKVQKKMFHDSIPENNSLYPKAKLPPPSTIPHQSIRGRTIIYQSVIPTFVAFSALCIFFYFHHKPQMEATFVSLPYGSHHQLLFQIPTIHLNFSSSFHYSRPNFFSCVFFSIKKHSQNFIKTFTTFVVIFPDFFVVQYKK